MLKIKETMDCVKTRHIHKDMCCERLVPSPQRISSHGNVAVPQPQCRGQRLWSPSHSRPGKVISRPAMSKLIKIFIRYYQKRFLTWK